MTRRPKNPTPCWRCNGTGMGTRYGVKCRRCGGTGEALHYFKKQMVDLGFTDTFSTEALDELNDLSSRAATIDRCIQAYAESMYQDDKRIAHVLTVVQHCVDRKAAETVWRLGDVRALFTFLHGQELAHVEPEVEDAL